VPLIYYKIAAAIFIFLVTVIAVFYPFKIRKHPHLHHLLDFADAFASGVFLGAALFHMLPEATGQLQLLFPELHYPLAGLLCVSGFLLLLFLERLSVSKSKNYSTIPYVLGVIIIIHSLIEGAVLGINTEFSALSIIFMAVIAHKGSESFALSVTLSRPNMAFTPILIFLP
jgi:solute carrier family 39 (zinc transporter), member 1/2/3